VEPGIERDIDAPRATIQTLMWRAQRLPALSRMAPGLRVANLSNLLAPDAVRGCQRAHATAFARGTPAKLAMSESCKKGLDRPYRMAPLLRQ